MDLTDLLALGALAISFASFVIARKSHASTDQLTAREIELVRAQLEQLQNTKRDELNANVSARIYKAGKNNWRLKVFNSGPAEAYNVKLLLDEQNQLIQQGTVDQKFPMAKLEKGQSVEIFAHVHLQSGSKEWLTINWDDPSKSPKSNKLEITI